MDSIPIDMSLVPGKYESIAESFRNSESHSVFSLGIGNHPIVSCFDELLSG
jgi:hypothetical protein